MKLARTREGELWRQRQQVTDEPEKTEKYDEEIQRLQEQQKLLVAMRPQLPKRAPLKKTELAGKLVKHRTEYKLLVDTLRVALANAEAELAARLAPRLRKPKEAEKTLRCGFRGMADT